MSKSAVAKVVDLSNTSNGAADTIALGEPYTVVVTVEGAADYLFHRWNPEAVDEKARAGKNSAAKKTDNLESYVARLDDGTLAVPGDQFRGSIVAGAKFIQDPRSPRKSGQDLFKAGVVVLTQFASLGLKNWHYLDRRRVMVQRNGINRTRPAIRAGYQAEFQVLVILPEYIGPQLLRDVIQKAGKFCGIGDFRPTFGRFDIVGWNILNS